MWIKATRALEFQNSTHGAILDLDFQKYQVKTIEAIVV